MADLQAASNPKLLGAGRSGQVFLVESQAGSIARKVFFGDTITNLIHYFFFGAPNPYIWNEDALQSAYYRRKIITDLVQFWFSDKLTVADATDTGWHEQLKAYQLDTKFAKGRAVALHQPFNSDGDAEVKDLVHNIMLSLQNKLIQAGFDGLVWQAGKGNPVALNNFLLVDDSAPDSYHFVWIDLEFGVPALIPLNPLSLFHFIYLNHSNIVGRYSMMLILANLKTILMPIK